MLRPMGILSAVLTLPLLASSLDAQQQTYLKGTNTEVHDRFGQSVSASVDTVVVGAPCEDSDGSGSSGAPHDNSVYPSVAKFG